MRVQAERPDLLVGEYLFDGVDGPGRDAALVQCDNPFVGRFLLEALRYELVE